MTTLILTPDAYDRLRALVLWLETTPHTVELGERALDQVYYQMAEPIDPLLPKDGTGVSCASVETEGDGLVAIIEDDAGAETRVHLTRGEEEPPLSGCQWNPPYQAPEG